jgi:hypothetical protein
MSYNHNKVVLMAPSPVQQIQTQAMINAAIN